ncbi:MAG: hypothetical protein JNK58_12685 [Phycisphaerae bacterium]|nr:hypothetical protein [Phycisphaerae bacterium]
MCGIGGILRIVKPGDADYPAADDPRGAASGAWLWRGRDARDPDYSRIDADAFRPMFHTPGPFLIPEEWLDALDDGIAWRGPDGAGRFRDRIVRPDGTIVEVALVHRRLAIIDLEGGAQPMVVARCSRCAELALGRDQQASSSAAGSVARAPGAQRPAPLSAVVFNGCLYNHRELRAELEAAGHVFESDHSDTEVLLHGLAEWEQGAGARLEGMFAFLCWERHAGRLVMARDGFGEKPMYGTGLLSPFMFLCASTAESVQGLAAEIQAPIHGEEAAQALDARALTDWIGLGYGVGATPWPGVTEFPINHATTLQADSLRPGGWLRELASAASSSALASADVALSGLPSIVIRNLKGRPAGIRSLDELESLLASAIESRLEADVPVGCFLSGGIDSSLISLYASRALDGLTTLCVRMPDERYDESSAAQRVADALGTYHVTIDADANAADDLVRIIETLGLPFGDSSILPTYWVCRAASEVVKVALSGDGGDELFYGYERYQAARRVEGLGWLVGSLPPRWLDRRDPRSRSEKMARLATACRASDWYNELIAVFQRPDRRALLGKARGYALSDPLIPSQVKPREADLSAYLPCDLLRKVDTASMMCNLEARCPMLDRALATRAIATPRRVLTRGGPKGMLRALARTRLPPGIADRPKQGFAIPISDWWRNNFGGLQTLLLDVLAGDRPFGRVHDVLEIDMGFVRQMMDEHWAAGGLTPMHTTRHVRPRDHGQRLFALVSLAIWAGSVHRREAEHAERSI